MARASGPGRPRVALDKTLFAQAPAKRRDQMCGIIGRSCAQIADHGHRWLLRRSEPIRATKRSMSSKTLRISPLFRADTAAFAPEVSWCPEQRKRVGRRFGFVASANRGAIRAHALAL